MARLERLEQDAGTSKEEKAAKDCGKLPRNAGVHGLRCIANHSIRAITWYDVVQ